MLPLLPRGPAAGQRSSAGAPRDCGPQAAAEAGLVVARRSMPHARGPDSTSTSRRVSQNAAEPCCAAPHDGQNMAAYLRELPHVRQNAAPGVEAVPHLAHAAAVGSELDAGVALDVDVPAVPGSQPAAVNAARCSSF